MCRAWCGALMLACFVATAAWAEPPEGGPPGRPGRPGGGRQGPPSPERFVEHALTFDADADGKLDRGELLKFAEHLQEMRGRGGPGGPPGGGEGGRGGGRGRGPGGPRVGGPDDERRGPPPGGE